MFNGWWPKKTVKTLVAHTRAIGGLGIFLRSLAGSMFCCAAPPAHVRFRAQLGSPAARRSPSSSLHQETPCHTPSRGGQATLLGHLRPRPIYSFVFNIYLHICIYPICIYMYWASAFLVPDAWQETETQAETHTEAESETKAETATERARARERERRKERARNRGRERQRQTHVARSSRPALHSLQLASR